MDIVAILLFAVLALVAHGSRRQPWMEWFCRVVYGFSFFVALYVVFVFYPGSPGFATPWNKAVIMSMAFFIGGSLFMPFRVCLSYILTVCNQIICVRPVIALIKKRSFKDSFLAERIFVPGSIPHLNGLWTLILTVGILLLSVDFTEGMKFPGIPFPIPVPMESLISYNFIGLIVLSACGCGIFVTRKPMALLARLGIEKPKGIHYLVAFGLVIFSFAYDYLWSLWTGPVIANNLSRYNSGTFTMGGGTFAPSIFLAMATAICAGIGEETLIRGALFPVFGAIPAGMLHGILHGQFSHAPILIIQVGIWSILLCIARRYTNTTTTIMAHATYNFLTTFLFSFNP